MHLNDVNSPQKITKKTQKSQVSIRFLRLLCDLCGEFFSKFQLDAKLNLQWIEDIAWRTEARDRRIVQIAAAVERGDVTYVNPVEQIEEINAEFTVQSFPQLDRTGYPNIDRGEAWTDQCVAAESPRTVREWVAVIVGVESGKNGEGSAALDRHQRTELEFPQQGHALGRLLE